MDAQIRKARQSTVIMFAYSLVVLPPFSSARADAVSEWNAIAVQTVASSARLPARAAHDLAIVRVAMFETMNFIEGKYVPRLLVESPAPLARSSAVEAVGAAHYVLTQLYPERKAVLDVALDRSLAVFPNREATSRARDWGRHLGGNVYAVWPSDPGSNRAKVSAAGRPTVARVRSSWEATGMNMEAWNSNVTRFVEAQALEPIERARILALISLTVSDVYAAIEDAMATCDLRVPCFSCALGAAIRVILETEFSSASLAATGMTNERMSAEVHWMPVSNDADKSRSAKAGAEIGLQALAYYRRVD